jgi:hypothetical protein
MFLTKLAEKIKTHTSCSTIFSIKNHAVYEIMWKNTAKSDRPQIAI